MLVLGSQHLRWMADLSSIQFQRPDRAAEVMVLGCYTLQYSPTCTDCMSSLKAPQDLHADVHCKEHRRSLTFW